MSYAIEVCNLTRRFGPTWALRGVNFAVGHREVVGFLGPNGAGKSTTMKILTGYLAATAGSATVDGVSATTNPAALRARIGYLPESLAFYDELRVTEYLDYRARLKGVDARRRSARRDEVIERCGLAHMSKRLVGQLSKGYRQRVGLADALLADPPVLILDEPTVGLDPHSIRELRALIGELGERHAVLLSSHILPEVEAVCGRVVIIHQGRIVASGTPGELTALLPGARRIRVELAADAEAARETLEQIDGVEGVVVGASDGSYTTLEIAGANEAHDLRARIAGAIAGHDWPLRELHLDPPTLEQIFVEVTGDDQAPTGPAPDAHPPEETERAPEDDDPIAPKNPTEAQAFWRTFGAQLRRELGGFLMTPVGWIALTIFLTLTASSFLLFVQVTHYHVAETTSQFFNFVFFWFLMLFLPPILTMRSVADERRSKRLEPLLTAPVSVPGLVGAKYVAALSFYCIMWATTLLFFGTLDIMKRATPGHGSSIQTGIDWGPVLSGYLGALSLGAMLIAMGLFASILARDQLVSAVLAVIMALCTFMVGFLLYAVREPHLREMLLVFSLIDQMRHYSKGIIDSRYLIYNLTVTLALLAAGTRVLHMRRWR